jgi:hypothetical protein
VLTVMPLNGVGAGGRGPDRRATVSIPGKVNYVPQTGHTDKMIAVEHWFSDVAQSELFDSLKLDELGGDHPAERHGDDRQQAARPRHDAGHRAYYTTPTAETTAGLLAGPQGILIAQGAGGRHAHRPQLQRSRAT